MRSLCLSAIALLAASAANADTTARAPPQAIPANAERVTRLTVPTDEQCRIGGNTDDPTHRVVLFICPNSLAFGYTLSEYLRENPTQTPHLVISPPGVVVVDPNTPMPPAIYTVVMER